MKTEKSAKSNLYAIQGEKKKHIVKKTKASRSSCPTLAFKAMKDLDVFVVSWVEVQNVTADISGLITCVQVLK